MTHSLFPIILLFALQVLHQTRTSHIALTREDTILSFLWNCFSWLLHYICRKTRKFFFMTIAYAHRTSHITRTHEDTILSFLWNCFSWPLHYICRKTWKFFFMTIAYAEKLGNFNELIICIIRYIKYLVGKQGCK